MKFQEKNENVYRALKASYLCAGFDDSEIRQTAESSWVTLRSYRKGEQVFHEADRPKEIMILAKGGLLVAKDTVSGKRIILSRIVRQGDAFGEIYVFKGLPRYDMYAETLESTEVLFIDPALLDESGPDGLGAIAKKMTKNQLLMFADKAYTMNRRLRILGSASIREKIARLLVERQGDSDRVEVMSRENMADYLNVTRPSLSREISAMCRSGIIRSEGRTIIILDQEKLEEYI